MTTRAQMAARSATAVARMKTSGDAGTSLGTGWPLSGRGNERHDFRQQPDTRKGPVAAGPVKRGDESMSSTNSTGATT